MTFQFPQSPDLNIIETVWDHLDRERSRKQPKSKEELWEVLKEAWYNIPEDYSKKLQDSLLKIMAPHKCLPNQCYIICLTL